MSKSDPASSAASAANTASGGRTIPRRGLLLVLSSPSGAGKTTLSRRLLGADSNLVMSVSATSRPPRPGEVDGRDYHFVAMEKFDELRGNGDLLESAEVFGNCYGTPRAPVEAWLSAGRDVLFDIDWQGTQQLKESPLAADVASIFLLPPSTRALEERLQRRAEQEARFVKHPAAKATAVADRMAKASDEMSHWAEYDYVLVNDEVNACQNRLEAIMQAERLRRRRQTGLSDFVGNLRERI